MMEERDMVVTFAFMDESGTVREVKIMEKERHIVFELTDIVVDTRLTAPLALEIAEASHDDPFVDAPQTPAYWLMEKRAHALGADYVITSPLTESTLRAPAWYVKRI